VKTLQLFCPAKVNLYLRILGRRTDGYHELSTLMQCVTLYDEITLRPGGKGIRLRSDPPGVPSGEGNLVWQAARLYQKETRNDMGLDILLRKHIPVGAGLGGGSSNAAGMLTALNSLYGGVNQKRLSKLAASLGADVPFFLLGTPALVTGIGEKLRGVKIAPPLHYLLVFPGWSVSTKWVYENLDLELTSPSKEFNIRNFIAQVEDVVQLLHNDLESVTARVHPWVSQTKAKLLDLGALGSLMSGSGPAVFGVFSDENTAKRAFERFLPEGDERIWRVRGC
jgi:4-diphosphocytidyl-2-C-methyl-D-erythritol kinase